MLETKFIGCNTNQPLDRKNNVFNIKDLKTQNLPTFDHYLQFIGSHDADKHEIYEGDILELKITPKLMDPKENGFYNSNLGKIITIEPDITSVLLVLDADSCIMSTPYDVYFIRKGKTTGNLTLDRNENGEPESYGHSHDFLFPKYLCCKGAVIIDNIVANPGFFNNL